MPVISWLNFGVHGGEVSSTDAALPVAYHLAAAQGPEVERLLANSVILLTASFNPDGNSREAAHNWAYQSATVNSDPNHALHRLAWPSGRTNHYWFDLNRQWMMQQQPEPVGWVRKFHQWRPNFVADFHEMRSYKSFYFHPGAPDRIHPLIDKQSMDLLDDVVEGPREFLDSESRPYFSEESYDNFYIGKGATYPHLYGSLGILLEQAASKGILETPRGLLSFRDNIRTHYRAAIAMLTSAAQKRTELLNFQRDFARQTKQMLNDDKVKAYVFKAPKDPAKAYHFIQLLERNKIKVKALAKPLTLDEQTFDPADSYIVETNQASYRMIKGMFTTTTRFENNTFYDVSGWTMPYAFGLEFAAVNSTRYKPGESVNAVFPAQPAPAKADVAYVFDWTNYYAPRALYRLLKAGYRPRIASKEFSVTNDNKQHQFGRGSVMVSADIRNGQDNDALYELIKQIAGEDGIAVTPVSSSHTPDIGMDLGSNAFEPVTLPNVLLVIGPGMSQYDAGEVWHLLDKRMHIPVTMINQTQLDTINHNYTHLVMADGSYSSLDEKLISQIETWVREGGTYVGIGDGAKWGAKQLLDTQTASIDKGPLASASRIDYANKSMVEAQDIIGGAVVAGDLDTSHPLGYGYQRRFIASHRNSLLAFETPENPYASVIQIADEPLISGFVSESNRRQLAGKTSLLAQRLGRGSVVLFTDDPNFRAYFYGTEKLFMNSLFFSRMFSSPR